MIAIDVKWNETKLRAINVFHRDFSFDFSLRWNEVWQGCKQFDERLAMSDRLLVLATSIADQSHLDTMTERAIGRMRATCMRWARVSSRDSWRSVLLEWMSIATDVDLDHNGDRFFSDATAVGAITSRRG